MGFGAGFSKDEAPMVRLSLLRVALDRGRVRRR
jgi:hypothetical protein